MPSTVTGGLLFPVRKLIIITLLTLTACSPSNVNEHYEKVAKLRAAVPYQTRIGNSHSMSTIVRAGGVYTVSKYDYNALQSGMAVVYWPVGAPNPICHFTRRRVGTDSWETAGMNQGGDIGGLGFLLTRENYIGVIFN